MTKLAENRVVIITGAAGALGSELAMQCAQSGWNTILLDKNRRGLEQLYDQIVRSKGLEPSLIVRDLSSLGPKDCAEIVNALEQGPNRLDALIHCATVFDGLRPLEQIQPDQWLSEMQVNINAPWLLSVSCLPLLRLSPRASIYFLSEELGKLQGAYWGAYGVGKHGVHALAGQLAAELSNTSIQVLSINPGPMKSRLRAKAFHAESPDVVGDPGAAAEKILQLLGRKVSALFWQIDLDDISEKTYREPNCA